MSKEINLRTLKRIDPEIQDILASASHVAVYRFDTQRHQWLKSDIEGSLLVYKKTSSPPCSSPVVPNDVSNHEDAVHPIIKMLLAGRTRGSSSSSSLSSSPPSNNNINGNSHVTQYGFVILNRVNTSNLQEDITPRLETQAMNQFLLYKNPSGDICCVWFYKETECSKLSGIIERLKATS